MNTQKLYKQLEEFFYDLDNDSRLNWIGQKDQPDSAAIMAKYADLYQEPELNQIRNTYQKETDFLKKRELKLVYFTLLGLNMYQKLAKLSDEISAYFSTAEAEIDGKKVPFYNLRLLTMNEKDYDKRELICAKSREIISKINPKLKTSLIQDLALIKKAGFKNYIDLYQKEKEIDYSHFIMVTKDIYRNLKDVYLAKISKLVQEKLNKPFKDINSCQAIFLLNREENNKYFTKEKLMPAFNKTIEDMGLNDEELKKRIHIDIEDRPKKNPRAVCFPMRVPFDIHLIIKPTGTHDDYEAFMHEAGHSLHFSHINEKLPFPFRELSLSHALTELFSYTFEGLARNHLWLEKYAGLSKEAALKVENDAKFNDLYMLVRYLGKFDYEYNFFREGADLEKGGELYSRTLTSYTGFHYHPVAYLNDMDGGFYSADYLRAWIGHAQLEKFLENKFGENWFKNSKSGEWLKKLWLEGSKLELEEILEESGIAKPFDIKPLINKFK